jgi:hypothetical protein
MGYKGEEEIVEEAKEERKSLERERRSDSFSNKSIFNIVIAA